MNSEWWTCPECGSKIKADPEVAVSAIDEEGQPIFVCRDCWKRLSRAAFAAGEVISPSITMMRKGLEDFRMGRITKPLSTEDLPLAEED